MTSRVWCDRCNAYTSTRSERRLHSAPPVLQFHANVQQDSELELWRSPSAEPVADWGKVSMQMKSHSAVSRAFQTLDESNNLIMRFDTPGAPSTRQLGLEYDRHWCPHFFVMQFPDLDAPPSSDQQVHVHRINEAQARVLFTLKLQQCPWMQAKEVIDCTDREVFVAKFADSMFVGDIDEFSTTLSQQQQSSSCDWAVYRLMSLTSHVLEPDPTRPHLHNEHLSAQICVPNVYLPDQRYSPQTPTLVRRPIDFRYRYHQFNDFGVTPLDISDITDFQPLWKLPCILFYVRMDTIQSMDIIASGAASSPMTSSNPFLRVSIHPPPSRRMTPAAQRAVDVVQLQAGEVLDQSS